MTDEIFFLGLSISIRARRAKNYVVLCTPSGLTTVWNPVLVSAYLSVTFQLVTNNSPMTSSDWAVGPDHMVPSPLDEGKKEVCTI